MTTSNFKSGMAEINGARIHYETAGAGTPFVMIHAGVADHRQWNNEFPYFAQTYRAVRYDMRGYGQSEPVEGEFNHLDDLNGLLDALEIHEPIILMGCSMGGGIAMDFALQAPERVKALIMVDSGPSGLELDVPSLDKFAQVEEADNAGDIELVCELETQIWFDGMDRTPEQVNRSARKLLYEMNHIALTYEARRLGKRLPNAPIPAAGRLGELNLPVLVIVGEHDTPYTLAAADVMAAQIRGAQKVTIADAAHLPNMEHPEEFQKIVKNFLAQHAL